jgi:hypothetical protein
VAYKQKVQTTANGRTEQECIHPPEIGDLLGKVQRLLEQQQTEKALEAIKHSRLKSEWITNATAVCLFRLGETRRATDLFRRLAGGAGGITLRTDAPVVFKTNFATALLAGGQIAGCLSVLREVDDETNPTVQTLRSAIEQWKQGLSLWQKIKWSVGDIPEHPMTLASAQGEMK